MKKIFRALVTILFLFSSISQGWCEPDSNQAQVREGQAYQKPRLLDFARKFPGDMKEFGKSAVDKKNIPVVVGVIGATSLLFIFDQRLVNASQELGNDLRISRANNQKTLFSIPLGGKSKFNFDGPFDSGSALYFIGDGWMSVFLAGGLLTYGLTNSDNRALQTSSEIAESVLAAGTVAQVLKHVTGRGSPFTTRESGGDWRFFPNQRSYQAHVAAYDAFPSGHLTASMATLTVVAENYSEHHWIRPVGYTMFAILGFQMLNNGVHWASDYPLALALGYTFGRIATRRGRTPHETSSLTLLPVLSNGTYGGVAIYRFAGTPSKTRRS